MYFGRGGGLIHKAALGDDSNNWTDNPDTVTSQGEILSDDRTPVEKGADDVVTSYRNSDWANSYVAKTLAYMTPYGIAHFAMGDRENGPDPLMTGLSITAGFNPVKGVVPAAVEAAVKIGTKVGTKLRPFFGRVAQAFQRPIIKNGITEAEMATNKAAANGRIISNELTNSDYTEYLKRLSKVAEDTKDFERLMDNNNMGNQTWQRVKAGKYLGNQSPALQDQVPSWYDKGIKIIYESEPAAIQRIINGKYLK